MRSFACFFASLANVSMRRATLISTSLRFRNGLSNLRFRLQQLRSCQEAHEKLSVCFCFFQFTYL